MSIYKYSWCTTPEGQMMGTWFHVTDINGEHVAHVVKRGPREWYAIDETGKQHVGSTRGAAVRKVA